jgi:hypothetical protein
MQLQNQRQDSRHSDQPLPPALLFPYFAWSRGGSFPSRASRHQAGMLSGPSSPVSSVARRRQGPASAPWVMMEGGAALGKRKAAGRLPGPASAGLSACCRSGGPEGEGDGDGDGESSGSEGLSGGSSVGGGSSASRSCLRASQCEKSPFRVYSPRLSCTPRRAV